MLRDYLFLKKEKGQKAKAKGERLRRGLSKQWMINHPIVS
jgi:hypothetical protein